jgi:hypothetical protein
MAELPFSLFGVANHSLLAVSSDAVLDALHSTTGIVGAMRLVWSSFVDVSTLVVVAGTPLAESTVVFQSAAADAAVAGVAASVGFPTDTLKYLLCLFLAYPLGLLFAALPSRTAKNVLSLVSGVVLAQWVFGAAWVHSFVSAAVAYALLALTSRIRALDHVRHLLVFAWMMGYMTAAHLYRLHIDYMGWCVLAGTHP